MEYRDLVTSHLREDLRIQSSVLAELRVYSHPNYKIYLMLYSGLMGSKHLHEDLLAVMVVFERERLRIMARLWTDEIRGDRPAYLSEAVGRLAQQGQPPFS